MLKDKDRYKLYCTYKSRLGLLDLDDDNNKDDNYKKDNPNNDANVFWRESCLDMVFCNK